MAGARLRVKESSDVQKYSKVVQKASPHSDGTDMQCFLSGPESCDLVCAVMLFRGYS